MKNSSVGTRLEACVDSFKIKLERKRELCNNFEIAGEELSLLFHHMIQILMISKKEWLNIPLTSES